VLALAVVLLSALLAAVSALSGLLTGLLAAALLLLTRSLLPLVLVRFLRVLVHCHSPMGPTRARNAASPRWFRQQYKQGQDTNNGAHKILGKGERSAQAGDRGSGRGSRRYTRL
jgi:hypothetical protein